MKMSETVEHHSDLHLHHTAEKRKATESIGTEIAVKKTRKEPLGISDLPDELLLEIFKYLITCDTFLYVSYVCKHWRDLVLHFKNITVGTDIIPNDVVYNWLSAAPLVEQLVVYDRKNLSLILQKLLLCENLETLVVLPCENRRILHSDIERNRNTYALCALFLACPKLRNFHIDNITCIFHQWDFLRLLNASVIFNLKEWSYRGFITKCAFHEFLSFTHNEDERDAIIAKFVGSRSKLEIVFQNGRLDFIF